MLPFVPMTEPTKVGTVKRDWVLYDAKNQILGRLATQIAQKLIGKQKPYFVKNLDCGDYVVVVNAAKVKVSGNKVNNKIYDSFSGYPGGRKVHTFRELIVTQPERIINEAVGGMLPKNKLRDSMLKRLFVFKDEKHTYENKFTK